MVINVSRLNVFAHHGVMPQERLLGANFYVSIEACVNVSDQALLHDQLQGTVNYADVIDSIRAEMSVPSNLLEHVAHRVGKRILADFEQITSLSVTIEKENPPCGVRVDAVSVSLEMSK